MTDKTTDKTQTKAELKYWEIEIILRDQDKHLQRKIISHKNRRAAESLYNKIYDMVEK